MNYDVTDYDNVNHPNDVPILFLDFDVIILDDVDHWAIVTLLNPCTPTPLRPDDVIFLFLVLHPNTLRPDDVIFSIYRLRPMMSSF